jgi:hypothetical protein
MLTLALASFTKLNHQLESTWANLVHQAAGALKIISHAFQTVPGKLLFNVSQSNSSRTRRI